MRRTRRGGVFGAVVLSVLTLVAVCARTSEVGAQSRPVIAVLDGEGPHAADNARVMVGALEAEVLADVRDQAWVESRAASLGLELTDAMADPAALTRIARGEDPHRISAFVIPALADDGERLVFDVIDGVDGAPVGRSAVALRRGILVSNLARRAAADLAESLAKTGHWDEVEVGGEGPLPTEAAPQHSEVTRSLPWLDIGVGIAAIRRTFTVSSASEGLSYKSSFYPGFRVGAEVYPLGSMGDWLRGLGLMGHLLRGFDSVTVTDDTGTLAVPARESEMGLGLVHRSEMADGLRLRLGLGFDALDFVLADNPLYSSTKYRSVWVATRVAYAVTPKLKVTLGVRLMPYVALSDSDNEFGTGSSTLGMAGALGVEYDVIAGLYLHTGYRLEALSTSFEGEGARGLSNVEGTDLIHDLTLWVGYRL